MGILHPVREADGTIRFDEEPWDQAQARWEREATEARAWRQGTVPAVAAADLTWEVLVRAEPGLAGLLGWARAISSRGVPRFCANDRWYGYGRSAGRGMKDVLCDLVGWDRSGHPILGTKAAYDLAYETLYRALPDCRGCACARWD